MISDIRQRLGPEALAAHIREVARQVGGNRGKMAERLGVSRRSVPRLIALYAPELVLGAGANQHDRGLSPTPIARSRAPSPAVPRRQFVYFVQSGRLGPVKIGVTRDVDARLGTLQIASGRPLRLLHVEEGDRSVERQFHARFDDQRLRGEWFRYEGDLRAYLDALLQSDM